MPESVVPVAKPTGALQATFPKLGPTFRTPYPTSRIDQQGELVVGWGWIEKCPVENPQILCWDTWACGVSAEGWAPQGTTCLVQPALSTGHRPLRRIFHYDLGKHLSNRLQSQTGLSCIGSLLRPMGDSKRNLTGIPCSSCLLSSGEMQGAYTVHVEHSRGGECHRKCGQDALRARREEEVHQAGDTGRWYLS